MPPFLVAPSLATSFPAVSRITRSAPFPTGARTAADIPLRRSTIAEVYPTRWRRNFNRENRTEHQHDAFCVAAWLSHADRSGSLATFLKPNLTPAERAQARVEGWILGVSGLISDGSR